MDGINPAFLENMPYGIGVHELILDECGKAVDYRLIYTNVWYETAFNLESQASNDKDNTYKKRMLNGGNHSLRTPDYFEAVALRGQTKTFKFYVASIDKWYTAMAYSPQYLTFVCIVTDVKQKVEPRLEALFDQTNDGVLILDLNGNYINANRRAADMLGYNLEEIKRLSFKDISAEIEDSKKRISKVVSGLTLEPYERKFIRKDGTWFYGDVNLELVYDHLGQPMYIQSVIRDITERKKSELELINLNRMQVLVSNIASSLVKVNRENYDNQINSVLKQLITYFSIDRVALMTVNHDTWVATMTHEFCKKGIMPQIEELKTIGLHKYQYWVDHTKKGEAVWIDGYLEAEDAKEERSALRRYKIKALLTIPFFEEKQVAGVIAFESSIRPHQWKDQDLHFLKVIAHMVNDARQRYNTEMALIEAMSAAEVANKAKTQFLANMSHEIRTPLNGMLGFISLLSETKLDETQAFYTHHAKESGRSLLNIVNDILDISKIEAGKLFLESLKVDLRALLHSIYENMKMLQFKKNIKINLSIDEALPEHIWADPTRLRQVLMNLMNNGIKFTEEGEVSLIVHFERENSREGRLTFEVKDTGIGISEDSFGVIFKAFSQGDLSTTRKYGGTGLGLTISSKIVSQMGGKLEFESVLGQGSSFYFTIKVPYLDDNTEIEKKAHLNVSMTKKSIERPMQFLIVEDMEVNRLLLRKILEKKYTNVKIFEAESGMEAISLFKEQRFDLVIMDVQMPGMDGLEATKRIRKIDCDHKRHTPVIALSAGVLEEEKQKCFYVGMDDFVSKPIDKEMLFRVVDLYLGR